jgi:hypothetical protein
LAAAGKEGAGDVVVRGTGHVSGPPSASLGGTIPVAYKVKIEAVVVDCKVSDDE